MHGLNNSFIEMKFVTQNMSFTGQDIFCSNAKDDHTISHKLRYLKLWSSLFAKLKFYPSFNTYGGTRHNALSGWRI